jgi:hypothetical protein
MASELPPYVHARKETGKRLREVNRLSDYIAKNPFAGSANTTLKLSQVMNAFVIANEGSANLTFTINGSTYTVKPGYDFDEVLDPFNLVSISATGEFFGYCRRRADEFR